MSRTTASDALERALDIAQMSRKFYRSRRQLPLKLKAFVDYALAHSRKR
jgi:hypothetical protein